MGFIAMPAEEQPHPAGLVFITDNRREVHRAGPSRRILKLVVAKEPGFRVSRGSKGGCRAGRISLLVLSERTTQPAFNHGDCCCKGFSPTARAVLAEEVPVIFGPEVVRDASVINRV